MAHFTLREKFELFDAANPEVYTLFVKYAKEVLSKGIKRYSIWAVANRVRWHYLFETERPSGEQFKISNNYLSFYSRKIMRDEPELNRFFQVKARKFETIL